jgi:hypothetical protein
MEHPVRRQGFSNQTRAGWVPDSTHLGCVYLWPKGLHVISQSHGDCDLVCVIRKLFLSWNTLYRDKAFPTRHRLAGFQIVHGLRVISQSHWDCDLVCVISTEKSIMSDMCGQHKSLCPICLPKFITPRVKMSKFESQTSKGRDT